MYYGKVLEVQMESQIKTDRKATKQSKMDLTINDEMKKNRARIYNVHKYYSKKEEKIIGKG